MTNYLYEARIGNDKLSVVNDVHFGKRHVSVSKVNVSEDGKKAVFLRS